MAFAALALWPSEASAKRTGQNMPCPTCHEGMNGPKIDVAFDPPDATPGSTVRVMVTAKHDMAVVGGVFVDPLGKGELKVVQDKTWLIAANQGTHTEPHPYANGQVEFTFDWVAPADVGTTRFEVWSNAANNNLMQADDSPSHVTAFIAHGCAGVWYYPDADLDGFGDEKLRELSCTPVGGLMTQGGDCDDTSTAIHTGVAETCNGIDEDCDGVVDNGFTPMRLYADADGDGYGALGGQMKQGCPPVAGFAPKTGDCDDMQAGLNPGIVETMNGKDDNCDGQIDEKPMPGTGGTGSGGQAAGGSPSGGTSNGLTAPDPGGCAVSKPARSTSALGLFALAALLAGGRHWRRHYGRSARRR